MWRFVNWLDTRLGHRIGWFCRWAWDHDEDFYNRILNPLEPREYVEWNQR